MTKKDALIIALSTLTASTYANPSFDGKDGTRKEYSAEEVREVIAKMINQLSKPRTTSEETKSKQAQARKDERAKVLAEVVTPLRAVMDKNPRTADEIFHLAKDMLPDDWTIAKTRYVLTHNELGEDVVSIDNGRNPHTYHL